ncbi:peptidoglycan editing factor PgeF [Desertibacillus haloalkaliphilus]|uniref:peptidoglycan editing factor PgeF n=1 Tax=Desertibacillus haloalkaliphilus TaxID=1328930 RepID=UPI0028AD4B62|nr:peptidoglycan editing factor PgeF [Desertibacillus haloalkaliphilus]
MKEPFVQKANLYLTIPEWEVLDHRLVVGFSTRNGGHSHAPYDTLNFGLHVGDRDTHVMNNRKELGKELNIGMDDWVLGEQVHQAVIQNVSEADKGSGVYSLDTSIANVDGLYTRSPNVLLASVFADCVPVYFFAPKHGLIGIAHAGWKGTVATITAKMIECWVEDELIPVSDIYVVIGPAISKEAYEVDERIITKIDEQLASDERRPYKRTNHGTFQLDLKECNKRQLLKAGIKEEQIQISSYCTATEKELFFSHRREGGKKTGRMIGFIALKNDE